MKELKNKFIYMSNNKKEICDFIKTHDYLKDVLIKSHEKIIEIFKKCDLILEVSPFDEELILYIKTNLDVKEAYRLLKKFDYEWWLDNSKYSKNKLCIDISF